MEIKRIELSQIGALKLLINTFDALALVKIKNSEYQLY